MFVSGILIRQDNFRMKQNSNDPVLTIEGRLEEANELTSDSFSFSKAQLSDMFFVNNQPYESFSSHSTRKKQLNKICNSVLVKL